MFQGFFYDSGQSAEVTTPMWYVKKASLKERKEKHLQWSPSLGKFPGLSPQLFICNNFMKIMSKEDFSQFLLPEISVTTSFVEIPHFQDLKNAKV